LESNDTWHHALKKYGFISCFNITHCMPKNTSQQHMFAHGCFWVGRAGTLASPRLGETHLICYCYCPICTSNHTHTKRGNRLIWTLERQGVFTTKSTHKSLNGHDGKTLVKNLYSKSYGQRRALLHLVSRWSVYPSFGELVVYIARTLLLWNRVVSDTYPIRVSCVF